MNHSNHSQNVLKQSKSNFALAFLGLARDQRKALEAVYAYCRVVDDIADESSSVQEAQAGLNEWKAAFQQWPNLTSIQSPIAEDLSWAVQRFPIQASDLLWILHGVERDLTQKKYKTLDDLLEYCDAVASAVGFCCMAIFGVDRQQAEKYVLSTGRALQLTNILRDIASDARRGRIYLPQDMLASHGLTEKDVETSTYDEKFLAMIRSFSKIIQQYYDQAEEAAATLPTSKIWPGEVMRKTYRRIFQKICDHEFNVFEGKIGISGMQKAWIALSQPRA